MLRILAANSLPVADIVLFIVLGAIIAISVAFYFLIPVFNKKQYQEQRENLKKREESFKANAQPSADSAEQTPTKEPDQTSDEE